MGTLISILDKKACSGSLGANTGKLGCLSLFGQPTHLILVKKGMTIPADQELNIAYITEQVQKGNMIPIIDASSFEDLSADDSYTTNTSGEKRLDLQGLVELKFMYEEGHEFYKELDKLKSYKSADAIVGDDENNWMMATTSAGLGKGFTLGHVTPEKRKWKVKGGDAESKALILQMLQRNEYDSMYGIAHAGQLDFIAQEVPQINGVELAFPSIPVDAETTFDITAILSGDRNSKVEGLLATNFVVTVDGVTVVPTGVVETTPGVYTFTVSALATGGVITVDLWDGTLNVNVAKDAGGVLYRSDVVSETVIA